MADIAMMTDPDKPPKAPRVLETRGRKLWRDVTTRYGLRVDELVILEQSCRCVDSIETLTEALAGAPLVVKGSQGQDVAHPLLGEVRGLRTTLAAHLKQLGLPDESDSTPLSPRSQHAKHAAEVRWARERELRANEGRP